MPTVPREPNQEPDFESRWDAIPSAFKETVRAARIEDRQNEKWPTARINPGSESVVRWRSNWEGLRQSWTTEANLEDIRVRKEHEAAALAPPSKLAKEAGWADIKAPGKEEMLGFLAHVESFNPDPPNPAKLKAFEDRVQQILRKPK